MLVWFPCLQYPMLVPASGPLHMLSPVPWMPFPLSYAFYTSSYCLDLRPTVISSGSLRSLRHHHTPTEAAGIKETSVGEDVGKHCGWKRKTVLQFPTWPSNSTPRYLPKRMKALTSTQSLVHGYSQLLYSQQPKAETQKCPSLMKGYIKCYIQTVRVTQP